MAERPLMLLLDGNALVHRAYHAIPPLSSASGEPTNATYGFTQTLLKVLDDLKPKYVQVAFDVGRTFRHDQFAEYKATRAALADDLRVQLERVRTVVAAFGLPGRYVQGYEADDVLAALAKQAVEQGLNVVVVTGDTDTLQLIGPHVKVLLSGHKFNDAKLYDEGTLRERYGLDPQQMVDYKSLKGDTSDNIPGVPGVGEVTATRLLKEFHSVEELYRRISELDPKLRSKLESAEAGVRRAKGLVKLVDDLPLALDLDHSRVGAYDRSAVVALFRELGFLRLMEKLPRAVEKPSAQLSLFGAEGKTSVGPVAVPAGAYHLVETEEELRRLAAHIRAVGRCSLDAETTSLRPTEAELVGISFAARPGEAYYVPVGHAPATSQGPQMALDSVREHLGPVLADPGVAKVAHNANFDLIVLRQHAIEVRGLAFDTMIAAYLLDPTGRNLGLKGLALQELGVEMTPIEDLIGKGKSQITMNLVDAQRVGPYACADADMTLQLADHLQKPLKDRQLWRLFDEIEIPLIPVLMDMECTGVALDVGFLKQMSRELNSRLHELEEQIQQMVGYAFNLNSSQQLSDALFTKLGLPTEGVSRGTSGRFSTAAEVLESLKGKHPVMDLLLEHRQLAKILSTYVDALPLLVNPGTGRVHTSWNQTGTVTGRVSSSDPNLQNIPIRTDLGRRVRQAFVARPGCLLLGADYSQVELRILAHLSGDESMLAAFQRGEDIHASTASRILSVPLEQVTPDMRRLAKTINFGLIYGMSDWGLAARTELSQQEASDFIAKYFAQFPRVRGYLDGVKQQAADQGFVETLLGRKRYFPELLAGSRVAPNLKGAAQRAAVNHPIQGSAADILKIAMIRLHDELRRRSLGSKMILQVHDELVLEVPDAEVSAAVPLVRSVMEHAYQLQAPLKADIKTGRHWGEME
jgi:DNA polymerase-1